MARVLGQVIARRKLSRGRGARPLLVEIGVPRRRATAEWACPYRIRGLGEDSVRYAFGVDAVQALQVVTQAIWQDLEPYRSELSWLRQRGLTGFFRYYPDFLGTEHAKRVEAAIDREIERESRRHERQASRTRSTRKGKRRSHPAAT